MAGARASGFRGGWCAARRFGLGARLLSFGLVLGGVASGCRPLEIELFERRPDAGAAVIIGPAPDASPSAPEPEPAAPEPLADSGSAVGPPQAVADAAAEAPSSACLPGATRCQACEALGNCLAGTTCHPQTGDCVPPCASADPACPGALHCSPLGVCVECITDQDCGFAQPERPVCITELGLCGCRSSTDCGGQRCEVDAGSTPADQAGHCEIEDD